MITTIVLEFKILIILSGSLRSSYIIHVPGTSTTKRELREGGVGAHLVPHSNNTLDLNLNLPTALVPKF